MDWIALKKKYFYLQVFMDPSNLCSRAGWFGLFGIFQTGKLILRLGNGPEHWEDQHRGELTSRVSCLLDHT